MSSYDTKEQSDMGLHYLPRPPCLKTLDQGDASVVVYSNCQCSSAFCLSLTFYSIYYTPSKLCLWWGILFSRCPSVRLSGQTFRDLGGYFFVQD